MLCACYQTEHVQYRFDQASTPRDADRVEDDAQYHKRMAKNAYMRFSRSLTSSLYAFIVYPKPGSWDPIRSVALSKV